MTLIIHSRIILIPSDGHGRRTSILVSIFAQRVPNASSVSICISDLLRARDAVYVGTTKKDKRGTDCGLVIDTVKMSLSAELRIGTDVSS